MNRTRLLTWLALLAASGVSAAEAQGLTLQGQLQGEPEQHLSIGIWSVSPAGQPEQMIVAAPVSENRWSVTLAAPPKTAQVLSSNLGWPGLLAPVQLSATPKGQEVRAYAFSDLNRNGQPDASEPLREVNVRDGNRPLFLVWVAEPIKVSAGRGYQANLSAGWNALQLNLGQQITLEPYSGKSLQLRLSP